MHFHLCAHHRIIISKYSYFCRDGVFSFVTEKKFGQDLAVFVSKTDVNSTDWDLSTPNSKKKSPLEPTHYVPLKYSYLSEWWWREVPLKEWSHSKLPTKISKKPPARASLAVALISLLSTQDIPKCQLTVTFGTSQHIWHLWHTAEDLAANDANILMSILNIFTLL